MIPNEQPQWREGLIEGETTPGSSLRNLSDATNYCPISEKKSAKPGSGTVEVSVVDEQLASALQTLFDETTHLKAESDAKVKVDDELTRAIQAKLFEKKPAVKSDSGTIVGTDVELTCPVQTNPLEEDQPTS